MTKIWSTCLVVLAVLSASAQRGDSIPGHRQLPDLLIPVLNVERVYDGDTLTRVTLLPWPGMVMTTSVRLFGVDTPEIRGKCDEERELARAARDFAAAKVDAATMIQIRNPIHGLYAGRVVAGVLLDGESLADMLIAEGHGREYFGGTRQPWCGDRGD